MSVGVALLYGSRAYGQFLTLDSAGARFGFPADGRSKHFYQSDVFLNCDLPWKWEFEGLFSGGEYHIQLQTEFSAGWIGRGNDNGFVGTAGLVLTGRYKNWPVWLQGGSLPTLISRKQFGTDDLGSLFQFTTYGGANWDITSHVRLGYRFQHMSNAGISHHNPGLNFHVVGLSWLF